MCNRIHSSYTFHVYSTTSNAMKIQTLFLNTLYFIGCKSLCCAILIQVLRNIHTHTYAHTATHTHIYIRSDRERKRTVNILLSFPSFALHLRHVSAIKEDSGNLCRRREPETTEYGNWFIAREW